MNSPFWVAATRTVRVSTREFGVPPVRVSVKVTGSPSFTDSRSASTVTPWSLLWIVAVNVEISPARYWAA